MKRTLEEQIAEKDRRIAELEEQESSEWFECSEDDRGELKKQLTSKDDRIKVGV
jgi:hypothetical protein